ncbi:macquaritin 1 [Anopheles sinensis]|uniref:Macquaritin 1 n=1 Tax=Anopheles sinensis TaxID=74873 RepID=A0A084WRL2_ANOSI|nr:macquaritin 1 [Anopheles sinensis]
MQWTEGDRYIHYLVCNFSANVIEGQPVYTAAASGGMGCTTKDTTYESLCLT